jgi:hypothetical protein
MTDSRSTENAVSEGTSESPCSPASEGYPEGWWHCTIHLNPETGEMHSDGDHRVRTWIQDKLANPSHHDGVVGHPNDLSETKEDNCAFKCARCGHIAIITKPLVAEICEECGKGEMLPNQGG